MECGMVYRAQSRDIWALERRGSRSCLVGNFGRRRASRVATRSCHTDELSIPRAAPVNALSKAPCNETRAGKVKSRQKTMAELRRFSADLQPRAVLTSTWLLRFDVNIPCLINGESI